jgi:hypothetical protein
MIDIRNAYKILLENLKGRDLLESLGGFRRPGGMDGINLAQDRVQWRVCENDIESSVPSKSGIYSVAKRLLVFQKDSVSWS